VSGKESRTVQILLRPESLLDPAALLPFLRRELYHIADMLDPEFGYEPSLPPAEGGPTHDRLLKERYRVLWDTTIDGRMARRGWASDSARAERLREFCCAFPMFGEENHQIFSRFFDQEPHTHAELVAFALDPRAALTDAPPRAHPGSRCPLCGFPTYAFRSEPEKLPPTVLDQIRIDFPKWDPSQGLCAQCADVYSAMELSVNAARSLPGAASSRSEVESSLDSSGHHGAG